VAAKAALQLFHDRSSSSPGRKLVAPTDPARKGCAARGHVSHCDGNETEGPDRPAAPGGQPGRASRRDAQVRCNAALPGARGHRDANRGVVRSEGGRHGIGSGMECEYGSILGEGPATRQRGVANLPCSSGEVWHSCDASDATSLQPGAGAHRRRSTARDAG
jgi:hypothetical protein